MQWFLYHVNLCRALQLHHAKEQNFKNNYNESLREEELNTFFTKKKMLHQHDIPKLLCDCTEVCSSTTKSFQIRDSLSKNTLEPKVPIRLLFPNIMLKPDTQVITDLILSVSILLFCHKHGLNTSRYAKQLLTSRYYGDRVVFLLNFIHSKLEFG